MSYDLTTPEWALYLKHLRESMSENTVKAYVSQLRRFSVWCTAEDVSSCPAEPYTVARYVAYLRDTGVCYGTIEQSVAAIHTAHAVIGAADPTKDQTVRTALRAASRSLGRAQRPKEALTIDLVEKMLAVIDCEGLINLRDRALLAVGFMSACRRSELSALRVSDVTYSHDVAVLHVRRSKTDPTGIGMDKCLYHTQRVDAIKELERWLKAACMPLDTPLFPQIRRGGHIQVSALSGHSIAAIVQARAAAAGLDMDVGGHSLRRGFVTSALDKGAAERSIMHQTGHRSVVVLRKYQDLRNIRMDNAAAIF